MMKSTEDTKTTIINTLQLLRISWESGKKMNSMREELESTFFLKSLTRTSNDNIISEMKMSYSGIQNILVYKKNPANLKTQQ